MTSPPATDFPLTNIPITTFVINTIAYAPEHEFDDDSSDEENDGTFPDELFNFDCQSKGSIPFTTTIPKYARKKANDFKELPDPTQVWSTSIIVAPFLQKLIQNGFEENDKGKLATSVSVSIGLNRMLSLSTRKNQSLSLELESDVETDVRYEKFGFYWKCNWYNSEEKPVEYKLVRKFYKQLKQIDSEKAQEFIAITERGIPVPYQELREYAKNHTKTKELIGEFREKAPNANIYLSLIDSDTVNFNGIYSAYLRIVASTNSVPTIMSTGYEFPADSEDNGSVYQLASQVDRMVRVITVRHIPLGVYYPEPNTCVLIPPNWDTIPESFIDKSFKKGDLESASLLRKVKDRTNATFIFSEDKALITTIPDRTKLTKVHKTAISFSTEFIQGASPTKDDIRSFKQISQSHFHEKVWYDNLFINGAITVTGCTIPHCKSLLAKIRNGNNEDRDQAILELKNYIDHMVVDAIVKAAEEVNKYVNKFEIEYIRSEDEAKLLKILKEYNIEISNFSRDTLLVLAQEAVLEMIDDEIIDPEDFVGLPGEILKEIFYNEEIIEMLQNEDIGFSDILNLYRIAQLHKQDFSDTLSEFTNTIEKGEYSTSDILERYEEDPLHLMFMNGEPDEIILENSDDEVIVKFGIEHYDIDIDWVRCELNEDRDVDSAALMDFDRIIGTYEEPDDYEDSYNSFDEVSDKISINNVRIDTIIQKYAPGLISSIELSNFITHRTDRTYLSKKVQECDEFYSIISSLSKRLSDIREGNTKINDLLYLAFKLRNEDEAVAIAKFDKVYDTLSEQEIALYEEYNDIEYALKAINPIISILSDIQTNVSVDNDHVLTSGLNNLNLSEVNSNNQVTVIGSSQDDSQSDSEW